ncbi:hypothetical protein LOZ36_003832 [Ophidiomyces ophidiicola]|nr:hypothetical protein LOZ36_003832 [Ophidiomyces ophidiicola]
MEDTVQLRNAFNSTHDFLYPVLNKEKIQESHGGSLVEILNKNLPIGYCQNDTPRFRVLQRALELLSGIHDAFVAGLTSQPVTQISSGGNPDLLLEDARRRRALNALLDLLSFEGIYPCLSNGVGIPMDKRVVSVLPTGVIARQIPRVNVHRGILKITVNNLANILQDGSTSIQPIITNRILPDLICGVAELAFNSKDLSYSDVHAYGNIFRGILNECSTTTLLPVLSSLLQSSTAPWFKAQISSQLSQVPLRKDGVFQTILFLASQFAPILGEAAANVSAEGPPITIHAIMQTSQLLSSVPQEMSPEDYFSNISPKILALLDGDDYDMKKTASYVIGNGILSKRALGAPGKIGFNIFVRPIFDILNGKVSDLTTVWLRTFSFDGSVAPDHHVATLNGLIVVPEYLLLRALNRLINLVTLHPNPSLLKRLINPVLLPLWGLQCYAKEHQKHWWEEKVARLLHVFFSVSDEVSRLLKLADNILWDGLSTLVYGPGDDGGISIRQRENRESTDEGNVFEIINNLDWRVDKYLELLAVEPRKEEFACDVFLHASQQWLLGKSADRDKKKLENSLYPELQKLVHAKITEKLLNDFKDSLSRHPTKVLELIRQLVESESRFVTCTLPKDTECRDTISFASVSSIVEKGGYSTQSPSMPETSESLSPAFSLLSTILTSPEFKVSDSIASILQSLKSNIDLILPVLPSSLVQPATTCSMLLDITLSDQQPDHIASPPRASHISDLETHRQALNALSSHLPPVQVEGISLISQLINKASPVLDIPATLSLLFSILTSTNEVATDDEFVYLNVIKVMSSLASRHPKTTIKTLADHYADQGEDLTLDQRLKIGEALLRIVQDLGDALIGDEAKILGEVLVEVASRRGRKPKARREREQRLKSEKKNSEELDEISRIAEQLSTGLDSEEEDETTKEASRKILGAWEAGATRDTVPDDLRVRASALSILASAIKTNMAGLGPTIASASVDLALSTLTLESGVENAILRRGAAVLLFDLIKSMDDARESGRELGFGFSTTTSPPSTYPPQEQPALNNKVVGNVPDILRVLMFVESKETDTVTRGHLHMVIESLEAWLEKSLLWGIRAHQGVIGQPQLPLGDRLAGLNIHPLPTVGRSEPGVAHPRIEEIE